MQRNDPLNGLFLGLTGEAAALANNRGGKLRSYKRPGVLVHGESSIGCSQLLMVAGRGLGVNSRAAAPGGVA